MQWSTRNSIVLVVSALLLIGVMLFGSVRGSSAVFEITAGAAILLFFIGNLLLGNKPEK